MTTIKFSFSKNLSRCLYDGNPCFKFKFYEFREFLMPQLLIWAKLPFQLLKE